MGNSLSPTVFFEACKHGDIHFVNKCLREISPPLKQKLFAHRVEEVPMISTPLFAAIQNHHVQIVELLLKHGMDPNARLQSFIGSETSLMHAIRWRDATMVDLLLRFRADSEEIDATGKTALHKACILRESSLKSASSALEMVQILLKYGADLTAIDKNGNIPLHLACLSGNLPLVQYFLTEHPAVVSSQLDFPNKMAKTPLMLACELNFTSIVSALLQAGANPFLALSVLVLPTTNTGNRSKSSESDSQTKAKRPHKKTALCWAVENGHEGIVDLLLGHHRHMLDTPASVETGETVSSVKEASTARSESVRSTLRLRHALQQPLDDVAGTDTESQVSASSSSSVKSSYRLGGWLSPTIPFMRSSTAITGQEIEFQERQRLVLEKDDSRYIAADDDLSDREESNYEEGDDMHSSMEADMHSITHLVGCCLLEAILLGHVAIAHLLLEHVHFYYQLQQQIHQDSEQKSSRPQNRWVQQALSKMYYRALSLSCQGHNRLMVRMMLAHLQEVNLPIPQLLVQYQTTLQGSNWQCLFGKNTPDESIVAMLQEQC